jgi:hypothetical protein
VAASGRSRRIVSYGGEHDLVLRSTEFQMVAPLRRSFVVLRPLSRTTIAGSDSSAASAGRDGVVVVSRVHRGVDSANRPLMTVRDWFAGGVVCPDPARSEPVAEGMLER